MNSSYQPEEVIEYFDDFGEQEWERLVQTPVDEVSLYIHTHYLKKHITPKKKVLEIGAGAGRFTQILAGLEAEVLVADISNKQLELNRKLSREYGYEKAIVDWRQVDICDLSEFASGSFDAVVAYGGPFSYVLDKRDVALSESIRVLKPRGVILLSVMSLWGTAHGFLDGVISLSPKTNQKIIATGDITPATYPGRQGNFMHLFRVHELVEWLEEAGLIILDKSAANCLSLTWNEKLKEIRDNVEKWNELLRIELEACAEDGSLNMGTHIIVVAQNNLDENTG
jgi:2-polyprenyl-3-methyl-5-hydroxy-6-metoxy-1,4-benzoquinol methylase